MSLDLYRTLVRPALFRLDAETAHHGTVQACRLAGHVPILPALADRYLRFTDPCLEVEAAGIRFSNPVGLGAGWDKSGVALRMLDHLGFGFVEIGSVSARPSIGNPKPRLFRLPNDEAIVVNYGLPNDGAEAVRERLRCNPMSTPIGVNVVKTNDGFEAQTCREEDVLNDYRESVSLLHDHASYITLNLSCPNTGDGSDYFSPPDRLRRLLESLADLELQCPVFLKLTPTSDVARLDGWLSAIDPFPFVRGLMLNLPPGKPPAAALQTPHAVWERMPGAVAGRPVQRTLDRCLGELHRRMPPARFILIGSGGIFSASDAYRKIRLGASLVQIYTALVYRGPRVVRQINQGLVELLQRDGLTHLNEAVGTLPPSEWDA
ncbi:quinone-dependent dihydroorotate dehydrogenase [Roseiconus nitratireducens]|uniref:Dihydroorotate dehydrogenase (quinone) n=1 Tax=Roseiconus nitratireducens TaxID=2605748 RepID=A0A5M6DJM2_9BACT|nr:quinone-dependent dihydroorotate dehydrogenase [Roseiconus nitratireducens]KAA5545485.1 quinone-dependent dihydroorotate dehydrogenase [Roseiconus nitratireducens]